MTCNWMKYVINSKVALSEVSFGIIINCVTVFSWKQFRKEQIQFSIFFFVLFCFGRKSQGRNSRCGSVVTNLTHIHEDSGSIPGLT